MLLIYSARHMIFDDAKWNAFVANPDANVLQDDPALLMPALFMIITTANMFLTSSSSRQRIMTLGRLYLKGIMEMDTGQSKNDVSGCHFYHAGKLWCCKIISSAGCRLL